MIVRDEESVLARCLESVKALVDEIIIVDTGSFDKTKEIASKYTDKIYDFEWVDDFAAARNFSFSKASMEYQMWLDADDIFDASEQEKFLKMKKELSEKNIDVAMLRYNIAFDEAGRPVFSYFRERIFKREKNYQWSGEIHECISSVGNIVNFEIFVRHAKIKESDPMRNIKIFEKIKSSGELSPRHKFYYARELMYLKRFSEAIEWFEKFLAEGKGWSEDNAQACLDIYECYCGLNDKIKGVKGMLQSFYYDIPHAEVCCKLGSFFQGNGDYKTAVHWFKAATELDINERKGFTDPDCYGFIPFIELCVCYDRLGDREKAFYYHKKAKKIKPKSSSVIFNEEYFKSLKT
jgi:glycosyltransferase involved in cell wall biosynthesis